MSKDLIASIPKELYIGGKWMQASDGQTFEVLDPATEHVLKFCAKRLS